MEDSRYDYTDPVRSYSDIFYRLLIGNSVGKIYAISLPSHTTELITNGTGQAVSLAANVNHILVASGKKILSVARVNSFARSLERGEPAKAERLFYRELRPAETPTRNSSRCGKTPTRHPILRGANA
jgi:hypothetical protein